MTMIRLAIWLSLLSQTLALAIGIHHYVSADDLVQQIVRNQTTVEISFATTAPDHKDTSAGRLRLNLVNLFPTDFMNPETRLGGGFLIPLCLFVYACLLLTVVIDSYFVQSLQYFSSVLHISPNIAGPTLMAFGTSSPEFFTSVYACTVAQSSSIGTGAIVGSSIVNTLAIPGICGLAVLFMPQQSTLSRFPISSFPIVRDVLFFAITVIIFILAIKDNSVDSLEALIFLFLYMLYIFTLYVWSNLKLNETDAISFVKRRKSRCESSTSRRTSIESSRSHRQTQLPIQLNGPLLEDNVCIRYSLMPFLTLVRLTVPRPCKTYFVATFAMSCLWIAMLTYFNLWMVSIIGDTFHLPEAVSGMTLLALGTNLPELISSFILVRKYRLPDMAICHTLGSNIFDILICLGLPWFIQILALTVRNGSELSELSSQLIPLEDNLLYFVCLSLLLSILALSFILYLTNCQLTLTTGILCISSYIAFIFVVFVLQIKSLL